MSPPQLGQQDKLFLEYVYAVLPAWGMHRMVNQRAQVVDFSDLADSLRWAAIPISRLCSRQITDLGEREAATLTR